MQFTGPCRNRSIFVRILGTIVAPNNIWTTGNSPHWIEFHRVDGVTISGGVLDGKGAALWACKKAGRSCPNGATNSQNVVVSRLTSLNSHMFHMVINFCHNVKLQGVRISAPGNSPNTDGIHVQFSTAVTIVSSKIATGDDCVSIGPGTANMLVDKVGSGVRVSDVTYQNIRGTSATQVAVNFDCSNRSPCRGIRLNNVRLTYRNRAAVASCRNAGGTAYGFVQPRSCL
ncbi:unnamed protein product [Linum tenue]|uniref:Polygalacturonase n=1 Tax=Linum tenue TaxID=586396 RepID=A0AAV0PP78_9ROSI|nr:unnamed protein product [Linum tenue]